MTWKDAPVFDCPIKPLTSYVDERGWLAEVFRADELAQEQHPVMGYISLTHPGVTRGPHEHREQSDLFVFFSGAFHLYLWDNRSQSPTYGHRQVEELGASNPAVVIVPPGVIHAYRNIGSQDAVIVNCPNRLYAGRGKRHPVDEIRHEDQSDLLFVMD